MVATEESDAHIMLVKRCVMEFKHGRQNLWKVRLKISYNPENFHP